ncbi:ribonuclease Z [Thalassomonas viridans]|uniref:Ribonuclease Z n=1 Tax=Thalassomonas viridans TaxID=137584 RepID=A0AAE9Z3U5_9GAMM|nr:ribonuclease Z [Thalassomonas viridans]WDE06311.1 ribonuclease Z [Thalassomonas viridans]
MELLFLGTSSGTPTKARNVSATAIKVPNAKSWCLVDCGEGTQHQVLRTNLSLNSLQAIFITHVHGDHSYGLPGLLASAAMAGRQDKLYLVGPPQIEALINAVCTLTDLYLPYELVFIDSARLNDCPPDLDLGVSAIKLSHRVPSHAFSFSYQAHERKLDIDKLKRAGIRPGPHWGELQKGRNVELDGKLLIADDYLLPAPQARKIIICGDNDTPDLLSDEVKNANVVVHEATYTYDIAQKVGSGPMHSSAKIVAEFAGEHQVDNLVLTHFSARYQNDGSKSPSIFDIEQEARKYYSGNLVLAQDFDGYRLDKNGVLTKL